MSAACFVQVVLPVPLPKLFDYLAPREGPPPRPGTRVLVPFGRRQLVGVVTALRAHSDVPQGKLLPVGEVLDASEPILDENLLRLLKWCWQYYKHAPGEVVIGALPPVLRKADGALPPAPRHYCLTAAGQDRLREPAGRAPVQHAMLSALAAGPVGQEALVSIGSQWRKTLTDLVDRGWVTSEVAAPEESCPVSGPRLTADQQEAVAGITADFGRFRCHLLDGVTGSGKTEVYLRLLDTLLAAGGQALVLVPEIGLTPQLLRRFRQRLGLEPAVIHSGLSAGARLQAWAAAQAGRAALVVGTRSALFTPMPRLGLILSLIHISEPTRH